MLVHFPFPTTLANTCRCLLLRACQLEVVKSILVRIFNLHKRVRNQSVMLKCVLPNMNKYRSSKASVDHSLKNKSYPSVATARQKMKGKE
jgi:hypothetical protein